MACRIEITFTGCDEIYSFDLPMDTDTYDEFADLINDLRGEAVHIRTIDESQTIPMGKDWQLSESEDDALCQGGLS